MFVDGVCFCGCCDWYCLGLLDLVICVVYIVVVFGVDLVYGGVVVFLLGCVVELGV